MKEQISDKNTLGEIVLMFPGAVEIFNNNRIDFCCGGHRNLDEAIKEKGINGPNLISELNDNYQKSLKSNSGTRDWRQADTMELIDFILNTHHVFMKKELPEIADLLFLVLKVHFASNGESLLKIHNLFGTLRTEIEEHLIKEEENLFPLIQDYTATNNSDKLRLIEQYIADTENEHEAAGAIIHQIEEITNNFTPPPEACTTYELVYKKMDLMFKDLFNHIHLENNLLFLPFVQK